MGLSKMLIINLLTLKVGSKNFHLRKAIHYCVKIVLSPIHKTTFDFMYCQFYYF